MERQKAPDLVLVPQVAAVLTNLEVRVKRFDTGLQQQHTDQTCQLAGTVTVELQQRLPPQLP